MARVLKNYIMFGTYKNFFRYLINSKNTWCCVNAARVAPPATPTIDLAQLENDKTTNECCLIHGILKSNSMNIAKSFNASARSLHFLHCVSNSDLKSIKYYD